MWDHGLGDAANSEGGMDEIDKDFVDTNWKSADFAEFCFRNARQMSHTPQGAINLILQDESNFWEQMHSSDIAYAVTQRVNNEHMWTDKWLKEKKTREDEGSEAETSPVKPGGGRRNGGGGGGSKRGKKKNKGAKKKADAITVAGTTAAPVKARWTCTGKAKYGDEGWDQAGRKFYMKVHEAIKNTNFGDKEWRGVWDEFWQEERKNHVKRVKRGKDGEVDVEAERVNVESLFDEEDMNNEWDKSEVEGFKITQISEV